MHLYKYKKIWLVFGMASLLFRKGRIREVANCKYTINVEASAFNYDFGKDKDGNTSKTIRVPKGSTVLYQITT